MEYLSSDFDNFCKLKGIQRHRTAPRNPQQNGIAERMNRTIMARVRCMLLASGVDKKFWGEAVSTAAYLINRSPSSAIDFDIPEARWNGALPDYTKLEPFGCRAYAHIKQGKLDARAQRCIFLGYQPGCKAYRLWCTESGNQKLLVSRDVDFNEKLMPCVNKDDTFIEVQSSNNDTQAEEKEAESHQALKSPTPAVAVRKDGRPRRINKVPMRFNDYQMAYFALCVAETIEYDEPATYEEAMKGKEWEQWLEAMKDEIESLLKNKTWELVDRPETQKVESCRL